MVAVPLGMLVNVLFYGLAHFPPRLRGQAILAAAHDFAWCVVAFCFVHLDDADPELSG